MTIRDAHKAIGTFVFTALDHLGTSGEMRWSVVAMYRNPTNIEPAPAEQPRRGRARNAGAAPTDTAAAGAALDRINLTQEALDIISDVVLPGSSLIVSDEGPSRETGKDTDFVVVMSHEPQGALKIRQREPAPPRDRSDRFEGSARQVAPFATGCRSSGTGEGRRPALPPERPHAGGVFSLAGGAVGSGCGGGLGPPWATPTMAGRSTRSSIM